MADPPQQWLLKKGLRQRLQKARVWGTIITTMIVMVTIITTTIMMVTVITTIIIMIITIIPILIVSTKVGVVTIVLTVLTIIFSFSDSGFRFQVHVCLSFPIADKHGQA